MTFTALYSGSAGNLYLVEAPGAPPLLIEAGVPYRDLQRALNHRVTQLAGALVSHNHGDHARAVPDVMRAGIDVFASRGCLDAIGATGHRAHAVQAKERFKVGPWTVLPFDTRHDAPEPLGFYVRAPDGESLLYATDSPYLPYRFESPSIIAIEANYSLRVLQDRLAAGHVPPAHYARIIKNHMSIEACIDVLRANDLSQCRRIVLLHLSAGNSDAEAFADAVRRATAVPTTVAPERTTA